MDELLAILNDLNPDIDYETEDRLIDNKCYDSFKIITLISEISDTFDVELGPEHLIPENFNSAKAMWDMIRRIQEGEE
ncbi:MAG: acyl carrier protein [Oscillospiraceae bacterium]|nr:acyl carrier protein [Oscillospiraceae bacterium]